MDDWVLVSVQTQSLLQHLLNWFKLILVDILFGKHLQFLDISRDVSLRLSALVHCSSLRELWLLANPRLVKGVDLLILLLGGNITHSFSSWANRRRIV